MKIKNKLLRITVLMFLMIAFSSVNTTHVYAQWTGSQSQGISEGSGTSSDPYLIKNENDLSYVLNLANNSPTYLTNKYFRIENDLDMSGGTWNYNNIDFKGILDGNFHKITAGNPFIRTNSGTIKNLHYYVDKDFINSNQSQYIGQFCYMNNGMISGVTVNCLMEADGNNSYSLSVIHINNSTGNIKNCFFDGGIESKTNYGYASFADSSVIGTNKGMISNVVSNVYMRATDGIYFVGTNSGTISNCYYNSDEATLTTANPGVTSKTTIEMQSDSFITLLNNAKSDSQIQWKKGSDNFPTIGKAETPIASGSSGTISYKIYSDGLLELSGNGKMGDYASTTAPWKSYVSKITRVNVKEGVTSIGNYAFYDLINVQSVSLPEGITSIGNYAFNGTAIEMLDLPNSVTSVGSYSFSNMKNLAEFKAPISLLYQSTSFSDNSIISNVTLKKGTTGSGNNFTLSNYTYTPWYKASKNSKNVKITVEDGVTSIGKYTFYSCNNLVDISLPSTVEVIDENSFFNCSKVASTLTLKDGIIVKDNAFKGARNISLYLLGDISLTNVNSVLNTIGQTKEILIKNTVPSVIKSNYITYRMYNPDFVIEDNVLKSYKGNDKEIFISGEYGITSIGPRAFSSNSNITSLNIGKGIKAIESYAFHNCNNLVNIRIDGDVERIESYAFYKNAGVYEKPYFNEISLNEGLKEIGSYAFSCNIKGNKYYDLTIPSTVELIGASAFERSGINNLTLVDGECELSIGYKSFGNNKIGNLVIPKRVKELDDFSFEYCDIQNLTFVDDGKLAKIADYSFRGNHYLKNITLGNNIKEIGHHSFYHENNSYYDDSTECMVYLNEGLEIIGDYAFEYTPIVGELVLPASLNKIGNFAFSNSNGFRKTSTPLTVIMTNNVSIGSSAFEKSSIKTLNVGDNVTQINDGAFCDSFVGELNLGKSVKSIGNDAFKNNRIATLVLPDSVETIGNNAFEKSTNLSLIKFGRGLTSIGSNAFDWSGSNLGYTIDKVIFYGEKPSLNTNSFANTKISKLYYPYNSETWENLGNIPCSDFFTLNGDTLGGTEWQLNSEGELYLTHNVETTVSNYDLKDVLDQHSAEVTSIYCDKMITAIKGDRNGLTFKDFANLKELTFYTTTSIESSSFANCENLERITIKSSGSRRPILNIAYNSFLNVVCDVFFEIPQDDEYGQSFYPVAENYRLNYGGELMWNYFGYIKNNNDNQNNFVYWEKIDDTLTLSGNGSMGGSGFNFWNDGSWKLPGVKKVLIGEGITTIGKNAFSSMEELESVKLPNTLTSIEISAFDRCKKLRELNLPDSLQTIGESAFYLNSSLESVVLPQNLKCLEEAVFSNCYNLREVVLPEGIEEIKANAFDSCTKLESINLPTSLNKIGERVFYLCDSLAKIDYPNTLNEIPDGLFQYCHGLKEIVIPGSVKKIGINAFENNDSLESIYFEGDAPEINQWAFYSTNTNSNLITTNLYYKKYASGFDKLINVNYGKSLRWVEIDCHNDIDVSNIESSHPYESNFEREWIIENENASSIFITFNQETNVEAGYDFIKIDDCNDQEIGVYTGNDLAGKTIEIPGNMAKIKLNSDDSNNEYGFKLDSAYYIKHNYSAIGTTSSTCEDEGFTEFLCNDCGYKYIGDVTEALGHKGSEAVKENIIDPTCTEKGRYDSVAYCENCGEEISRETITVDELGHVEGNPIIENQIEPNCVNEGSYDSVVYCERCHSELSRLNQKIDKLGHDYKQSTIAPSCTSQGYILNKCSRCESEYRSDYIDMLEHEYDEGVVKNEAVGTTDGLKVYTCISCGHQKEEIIPSPLLADSSIGDINWSLSREGLLTISGNKDIPDFSSDYVAPWKHFGDEIKTITISSGIESIGNYAFDNLKCLTTLTTTNSIKKIGNHSFENCDSLAISKMPGTLVSIGDYAFYGCDGLTTLTLPSGLTSIGNYAFAECNNIAKFTNNLTQNAKVGNYAFSESFCNHFKTTHIESLAPTCSAQGHEEGTECAICHKIISGLQAVDTLPHTPGIKQKENVIDATLTTPGSYDEVVYCEVCESEISREHIVFELEKTIEDDIAQNIIANEYKDNDIDNKVDITDILNDIDDKKENTEKVSMSISLGNIVNSSDKVVINYEVHPVVRYETLSGQNKEIKIENSKISEQISFRLAIPSLYDGNKVKVIHNNTSKFVNVENDNGNKYITLNENSFSIFSIELADIDIAVGQVSLTLSGNIGVNFKMKVDEGLKNDNNYAVFTFNGNETKILFRDAAKDSSGRYIFTYLINAKQMTDNISLKLFDYNDNEIVIADSKYVQKENNEFVTSVIDYRNQLNKIDGFESMKELVDSMANFGYYNQIYGSGYHVGTAVKIDKFTDLVNNVSLNDLIKYEKQESGYLPEGISKVTQSLVFGTETTIKVYFYPDSNFKGTKNYSVICNDTVLDLEYDANNNRYFVSKPNVGAHVLNKNYTFTISDNSNTSYSVTCSALSYCYSCVKQYGDDENKKDLVDICKALYLYSEYAQKYQNGQ